MSAQAAPAQCERLALSGHIFLPATFAGYQLRRNGATHARLFDPRGHGILPTIPEEFIGAAAAALPILIAAYEAGRSAGEEQGRRCVQAQIKAALGFDD